MGTAEREAKIGRSVEVQNPPAKNELRAIIDSAPVFLWSDLPDGYCDFLNQRWLNYFNLSLQEAQGAGWATVLHPDDAAHHLESWQKSISKGIPFENEARFRRYDGEYRWFLTRAEPLRDKTGRIVKWYGTNIDIENLKRTEKRLRQSEAYLAEAQRLSRTGSAAYNEREILYWSEEASRIWGFDPLQGIPSREAVWQRIHPDDLERVNENIEYGLREKRSFANEFRIILPDGTVKHIEAVNYPVFSASGELLEIIVTGIDVTERKRAEDALRESEGKIRRLVDANILGICIWNLEGAIVEANEAFLHMMQYDREDVVSDRLRWTDLTPAKWRERDERAVAELRSTGTFQPFEKEYFRKDGSRVPVLIGGALFEQSRNEGVAFVLDLTERKCAEEALQRSEFYLSEGQRIARIGSWAFNPSGFFDHWSQELFQIYGLDPQKGAPTLEQYLATIHPLDRDFMAETIKRMHAERCGCDVKKRIVLPDGKLRYVRCVGIPLIEDEVLKGFLGTAMDITEQELLTQELRESEGKFRDYAETASDWFWEIGPDYKFTLLTENAFGSHAADRIGTACWDHALDLETEPEKWRLIQATLDSRKPFRDFVYRGLGGNGSPMYVRASGKPVFDANGDFRGYRGTGTDVTAIMRAQEALRESERSARSAFDGIAGLVSILAPTVKSKPSIANSSSILDRWNG